MEIDIRDENRNNIEIANEEAVFSRYSPFHSENDTDL
jgi:hypothetical protein